MPLLAGFLLTIFQGLFESLVKRLTVNAALAISYITIIGAAWLSLKLAVAALLAAINYTMPAPISLVFNILLPPSISTTLALTWTADATISGWGWFQQRVPVLANIFKA